LLSRSGEANKSFGSLEQIPRHAINIFRLRQHDGAAGLISANRLRRHVRCFIIQPVFILVFIALPADVRMLDPLRCQLLMLE